MSRRSYIVKRDSALEKRATAGTRVYDPRSWDYGLASDDTRATGREHISVTLDPHGNTPTFTIPVEDLEEEQQ